MTKSITGIVTLLSLTLFTYFLCSFIINIFLETNSVVEDTFTSEVIVFGPPGCGGCSRVVQFDPQIAQPMGNYQQFRNLEMTVVDAVLVHDPNDIPRHPPHDRWDFHLRFHNISQTKEGEVHMVNFQLQDMDRFYDYGDVLGNHPLGKRPVPLKPGESLDVGITYWVDAELETVYWIYADTALNEEGLYIEEGIAFVIHLDKKYIAPNNFMK
jgi:hypothetical protein